MRSALTRLDAAISVPKVLLHDHLDGGLRPATVLELADEIGWELPEPDEASLQSWFTAGAATRDLLKYLATFEHTIAVMQTEGQLERVAYECALDLAADGVVYAEVRFAPELHQAGGLSLELVVGAVTTGFRRGEADAARAGQHITVNAICCAMRTEQRSMEIAQLVDRLRGKDSKVIGFDLAGAETGWPPSLHADALAFAKRNHFNVTIHASEPPDLELIDEALFYGAHRIGHGVRLQSDITFDPDGGLQLGDLAQYVLDRQVHLEMAPTCHVHVGAVPDLPSHPIGPMLRHGFNVSINTDNRLMSGVMPSTELFAVAAAFGLSWEEIEQLMVNGMTSAFAPHDVRNEILNTQIRPWFTR